MRRSDILALGELAGQALAAGGGLVKEMHEGIAGRPFEAVGPAAAPARVIHDGISQTVYGAVRGALRAGSRAAAAVAAGSAGGEGTPLEATPVGALTIGALNGLYGNHLAAQGNRLALGMEVRREGREVRVSRDELAAAFPDSTSRIVVFIHGLCESDESWSHFPLGGERPARRTYGERLQDELSFTPVYVRYNTGLRISDNGRRLARVLDDLTSGWPTSVEELVLVGHSMGGLVARAACHYGEKDGLRFTDAVRHVFCLGAPHLGADLEKGANVLGWAFTQLPETRALGTFLNARSVGIKDLRFGSCVEEDWCDCDPDELLSDRCQEVPFLPDATYYFIAAQLREGPLGSLLGDLLVRIPSASGRGNGRGRCIPFEVDNGCELSGLSHFDLLNHPAVYDQICRWINRPRARPLLPAGS